MKNLILKYHFWILGILATLMSSCSTAKKTLNDDGAKKIFNLAYGEHERNVMDVFLPKQYSPDAPLVMVVHGGAWVIGRKEHTKALQNFLFKNNIPSVNINYRLVRKGVTYKQQLEDLHKAVQKVNEKSKEWNLKPNNIILLGESAGGHLSLLYGYQHPEHIKKIISLAGPTDFYSEDYRNSFYHKKTKRTFQKVVGEKYGENLENFKKASPLANVSNVPTLIFQGENDGLVSKKQGLALDSVLTEKSVPHQLIYMKNTGHAPRFINVKKRNELIYPSILKFISH